MRSNDIEKATKIFFGIWLAWVLVVLAGIAGLIYVAWHFISKLW